MADDRPMAVRYLKTNGPSVGAEIPPQSTSITPRDRDAGVRGFDPRLSGPGGTKTRVGKTTTVYYLEDVNDPEEVIREWVQVNQNVLDASPRAFILAVNSAGSAFKEVSKEVARDLYGEARWRDEYKNTDGGDNPPGVSANATRKKLLDMDPSEVFGNDADDS